MNQMTTINSNKLFCCKCHCTFINNIDNIYYCNNCKYLQIISLNNNFSGFVFNSHEISQIPLPDIPLSDIPITYIPITNIKLSNIDVNRIQYTDKILKIPDIIEPL